jgi:hypothetical protein
VSEPGRLAGRLVALGITGSIAAFKAVNLLRLLRAEGADVVVLMTPSATRFVAPLTLAALSRRPVDADVLDLLPDGRIGHVITADAADVVVVAPATAHWLGAMAHGLAADVVTATCLATSAPVVVAPAMDGDMYAHPATQANLRILRDGFGYRIVEPEAGSLASGQVGIGRLAALERIVDAAIDAIGGRPIRKPDAADRPPRLPDADNPGATRTTWPVGTWWSPRAGPRSRSIPSGSLATAAPARWASRSARPPAIAARGSRWSPAPSPPRSRPAWRCSAPRRRRTCRRRSRRSSSRRPARPASTPWS